MNPVSAIAISRTVTLTAPSVDRSLVQTLAWRALRIALVGYCLLGLVSYAPTVDAKGHCDCPLCELP